MMRAPFPENRRQSGTVLLIAMVMLLIMTILGLSSMRGTTQEERMAGNWRDQHIAFQAAEAALRTAEMAVAPLVSLPTPRSFPCGESDGCLVFEFGPEHSNTLLSGDFSQVGGFSGYGNGDHTLTASVEAPKYLIEYRGYLRDHLGTGYGSGTETGRDMYQITAFARGQTVDAVRILQSTYAKRFN